MDDRCAAYYAAGGWGPPSQGPPAPRIPNRNTRILNNLVYNPTTPGVAPQVGLLPGHASGWARCWDRALLRARAVGAAGV